MVTREIKVDVYNENGTPCGEEDVITAFDDFHETVGVNGSIQRTALNTWYENSAGEKVTLSNGSFERALVEPFLIYKIKK